MRTIVLVALITLSFSSASFLRNLAEITITGLKNPATCIAAPSSTTTFVFTTTCTGQTDTSSGNGEDFGISFNEKTSSGSTLSSATTCKQGAADNADLTCKLASASSVTADKIYIIKAAAKTVGSDTVKAWDGVTVGVTAKAYVAPGSQTAQELKYEDDKFNFTVAFAADLGADLPTIKVNNTAVECSVMTDKKKLTCLMKKDTFKEEDKEKPYIATITSVCGIDETATVTIKASASFYSFSKIALAVIALFLF